MKHVIHDMVTSIDVIGAREHNLKNISVSIPKNAVTVITGPSGSGKSTLALDVLYTEGKRRYVESLSSYARQFLGLPPKPDVDQIKGLCPAVAIDQKIVGSNPRSTVGTITEIYDYMRVLFARIGQLNCPRCDIPVSAASSEHIAQSVYEAYEGQTIVISAPFARYKKGEFINDLIKLYIQGHRRYSIDGTKYVFKSQDEIRALRLKKTEKHTIDILIDSFSVEEHDLERIQEAVDISFNRADGLCKVTIGSTEKIYAQKRICLQCSSSFTDIEPRLFSFNSPVGACSLCHGLGKVYDAYDDNYYKAPCKVVCTRCKGKRLNPHALSVHINDRNIYDVCSLSLDKIKNFCEDISLTEYQRTIADRLIKEIVTRLSFLIDVGLHYLTLNRSARTLSGGEGQRIRLATQIGSALSGVLYILDEPSIGLHQRDNDRLISTLHSLKRLGNTVIVVEHDTDTMKHADHIIDMGPEAGVHGGSIVSTGTYQELCEDPHSLTGQYLSGKQKIALPDERRKPQSYMTLSETSLHNLKNLTVDIPLGVLCGISGVSGSGKSTLIMQELVPALKKGLSRHDFSDQLPLKGYEPLENMVMIDQTPIGRTSKSTPATYLGIFDHIRQLFSQLPESQARGYTPGRFSFNVAQGRCAKCSGEGSITISMHFLADVTMECDACKGRRFDAQTLDITYKGYNIADILEMTAGQAVEFFKSHAGLYKKLSLMCDVGLDYIALGQPSTTLSGGEAQRIKLTQELCKRGQNTLYILDEPTTGLHMNDIKKLLAVLNKLVDKGNSLIVIEHNLDVLKTTDYIIDLGPEGGDQGGEVVFAGPTDKIVECSRSYTGLYLKPYL
jgi:excinuclease ABC subunit A